MAGFESPLVNCKQGRAWPTTADAEQRQSCSAAAVRHSRRCDGWQAQSPCHCAAQQGFKAGNGAAQPYADALQQQMQRERPGLSIRGAHPGRAAGKRQQPAPSSRPPQGTWQCSAECRGQRYRWCLQNRRRHQQRRPAQQPR